jgi:hypothetical protein
MDKPGDPVEMNVARDRFQIIFPGQMGDQNIGHRQGCAPFAEPCGQGRRPFPVVGSNVQILGG